MTCVCVHLACLPELCQGKKVAMFAHDKTRGSEGHRYESMQISLPRVQVPATRFPLWFIRR